MTIKWYSIEWQILPYLIKAFSNRQTLPKCVLQVRMVDDDDACSTYISNIQQMRTNIVDNHKEQKINLAHPEIIQFFEYLWIFKNITKIQNFKFSKLWFDPFLEKLKHPHQNLKIVAYFILKSNIVKKLSGCINRRSWKTFINLLWTTMIHYQNV